jgi:hypothetical protein
MSRVIDAYASDQAFSASVLQAEPATNANAAIRLAPTAA